MSSETTSETEHQDETSTTNQTVTKNKTSQTLLISRKAVLMMENALGEAQIDEPEALVRLLLFLSDTFDHPGLKAAVQTLVRAAFDNSIVGAMAFEEYVEAIRGGRNPLKILRATLLASVRGEFHDETGAPDLNGVAAEGPRTTELNVKWAGIARLFIKGPATLTVREIRDGLAAYIEEAVADRNVDTLALLLRWFVAESQDTTIEQFRRWLEAAEFLTRREPPTNGGGGCHG
jgi:hypothetical protein